MRKTWRVNGISETYQIAKKSDVQAKEKVEAGPHLAFLHIDRWLADPFTRQTLIDMYESTAGLSGGARLQGLDMHRYIKPRLLEAFRRGDLVFLRVPHTSVIPVRREKSAEHAVEEEPAPAPEPKKKKSWIQIELVDQDGDAVPNAAYELELADGSKKSGKLDADGKGFISGVEPGTCRISFLEFDASEWDSI